MTVSVPEPGSHPPRRRNIVLKQKRGSPGTYQHASFRSMNDVEKQATAEAISIVLIGRSPTASCTTSWRGDEVHVVLNP